MKNAVLNVNETDVAEVTRRVHVAYIIVRATV